MVLDVSAVPESPSSENDEDELTIDLDMPRRKGLNRLRISHLLHMVLQDAQTRLFFRAQSVIQSDIRYYAAKPDDLAYPDKLVGECQCIIFRMVYENIGRCEKAFIWFRNQRKRKHQPTLPTSVLDQAGHLVSYLEENGLGAFATSRFRQGICPCLVGWWFFPHFLYQAGNIRRYCPRSG